MRKFKILEDIHFFGKIIFSKDQIICLEGDSYQVLDELNDINMKIKLEDILNDSKFNEITDNFIFKTDINDNLNDDMAIKKFRIQIDIKTSLLKLKEIEIYIRDLLDKII